MYWNPFGGSWTVICQLFLSFVYIEETGEVCNGKLLTCHGKDFALTKLWSGNSVFLLLLQISVPIWRAKQPNPGFYTRFLACTWCAFRVLYFNAISHFSRLAHQQQLREMRILAAAQTVLQPRDPKVFLLHNVTKEICWFFGLWRIQISSQTVTSRQGTPDTIHLYTDNWV